MDHFWICVQVLHKRVMGAVRGLAKLADAAYAPKKKAKSIHHNDDDVCCIIINYLVLDCASDNDNMYTKTRIKNVRTLA